MSGGGQSSSSTHVRFPKGVQKQLKYGLSEARRLYDTMGQPPSLYTEMDPRRRQFLEGEAGGLVGAYLGDQQKTLSGGYLGEGSPYLDTVINRSLMDVQGQVGAGFGASGRYGSGQWAASLADAMTGTAARFRDANYQAERDRMIEAGRALPQTLATGEYIGAAFEEDAALRAEEAYRQYRAPQDRLQDYLAAIYGHPAAQRPSVSQHTGPDNSWEDILGGILMPNVGGMIGMGG